MGSDQSNLKNQKNINRASVSYSIDPHTSFSLKNSPYSLISRCSECTPYGPGTYGHFVSINCVENITEIKCNMDINHEDKRVLCTDESSILECLKNPTETFTKGEKDLEPINYHINVNDLYTDLRNMVSPCGPYNDTKCYPYTDSFQESNFKNLNKCPSNLNVNYETEETGVDKCSSIVQFTEGKPNNNFMTDYCKIYCPSEEVQRSLVTGYAIEESQVCDQNYYKLCVQSGCSDYIDPVCEIDWNSDIPDLLPVVVYDDIIKEIPSKCAKHLLNNDKGCMLISNDPFVSVNIESGFTSCPYGFGRVTQCDTNTNGICCPYNMFPNINNIISEGSCEVANDRKLTGNCDECLDDTECPSGYSCNIQSKTCAKRMETNSFFNEIKNCAVRDKLVEDVINCATRPKIFGDGVTWLKSCPNDMNCKSGDQHLYRGGAFTGLVGIGDCICSDNNDCPEGYSCDDRNFCVVDEKLTWLKSCPNDMICATQSGDILAQSLGSNNYTFNKTGIGACICNSDNDCAQDPDHPYFCDPNPGNTEQKVCGYEEICKTYEDNFYNQPISGPTIPNKKNEPEWTDDKCSFCDYLKKNKKCNWIEDDPTCSTTPKTPYKVDICKLKHSNDGIFSIVNPTTDWTMCCPPGINFDSNITIPKLSWCEVHDCTVITESPITSAPVNV
jgi:hypothetical protein